MIYTFICMLFTINILTHFIFFCFPLIPNYILYNIGRNIILINTYIYTWPYTYSLLLPGKISVVSQRYWVTGYSNLMNKYNVFKTIISVHSLTLNWMVSLCYYVIWKTTCIKFLKWIRKKLGLVILVTLISG